LRIADCGGMLDLGSLNVVLGDVGSRMRAELG